MKTKYLILSTILCVTNLSFSQYQYTLLKDIAPKMQSSYASNFKKCNGWLFFTVVNANMQNSLWKTDGTEVNTLEVMNLGHSITPQLFVFKNKLYYNAYQSASGIELWHTDGSDTGTKLLKDINEGYKNADIKYFHVFNNQLYFTATNNTHGQELWQTDGTSINTKLLKDINIGDSSSQFYSFYNYKNKMYFMAKTVEYGAELYSSDGTINGTFMLKDICKGKSSSNPINFMEFNGYLFFTAFDSAHNIELWRTDGTEQETNIFKDINLQGGSYPNSLNVYSNKLFFTANDGYNGNEIWHTDGTLNNTQILNKITLGSGNFPAKNFFTYNNTLFFSANDGVNGYELWRTDGINAQAVKSNIPNSGIYLSPNSFTNFERLFYFIGNNNTLFQSDGNSKTTFPVFAYNLNIVPEIYLQTNGLIQYKDALYFTANYPNMGYELVKLEKEKNTSIEKINSKKFSIYPNPCSGKILQFNQNISADIYNVDGKIIYSLINTNFLNIENIENGIYYLKNMKGETYKFIIQKE